MASSACGTYEDARTGRSSEGGVSSGQISEALAEWRSSEQVENGTPSTSPPYWDCDDDDDAGPKPSQLYGKYTWKIDKFSQINKRELRSNAFDVGGYKWYILIYPQGCDVCNHLSLFLCVANHDKLLPGWSHFAQFTIAVVNKDPKKSKYSDTLHRFWKKEHDWGWKKFMELSKVLDGFVDTDSLIIKAQVQVIRERADRPFRCLDRQYRRELVRVYLTNVEQICRRFVEERRVKLGKLLEDRARWSSFCAFWLGMDQNSRRRMSKERSDSILKVVVKNFFVEKEVTSTLVMDSLYSGLMSLEGLTVGKKGKAKHSDAEEQQLVPIVCMENNIFVLVDDVLLLLESAALEPLPPKDEKGPQNRTKDATSGDEFNKDSIERDERRLTELGRRTIEIFVLAQIFGKIEVAYQEAVALKRQEELIREEEAAWLAETEQKAKRASGKEKKSKKKQAKQKRNNSNKTNDKGTDEKAGSMELYKIDQDGPIGEGNNEYMNNETETVVGKPESDVSDSIDCVINPTDSEDRDASPVNWDTDSSEVHPSTETSCSGLSDLSAVQNGIAGRRSPSVMDDSSSTCSTDSIPPLVMNAPSRWTSSNHKKQKSPSRGRSQRNKSTCKAVDWASETLTQPLDAVSDLGQLSDISSGLPGSESREQEAVKKVVISVHSCSSGKQEVLVAPHPRKQRKAESERPSMEKPSIQSSPRGPAKDTAKDAVHQKSTDPILVKSSSSYGPKLAADKSPLVSSVASVMSKPDPHNAVVAPRVEDKPSVQPIGTTENPKLQQVPAMSRPLCDPGPRPTAAPVVSMVQKVPSLARSVSAAGRLGPDPSPATHSYFTQSYRNAIMGSHVSTGPASFSQPLSPSATVSSYSQQPSLVPGTLFLPQGSERIEPISVRPSFSYGMLNHGSSLQNGLPWDGGRSTHPPAASNGIRNFNVFKSANGRRHDHLPSDSLDCTSGRQSQSVSAADEFPHLDIINDLLDEDHGIGMASSIPGLGFQSFNNGLQHQNHPGFAFPGDTCGMTADIGLSTSSCRFERSPSYHDMFQHSNYSGGLFDGASDMIQQQLNPNPPFVNGPIDGLVHPSQWQMMSSDRSFVGMGNGNSDGSYPFHVPDYSAMACGINGYGVFRPSSGL